MSFTLDLADIDFVGHDLHRPECVLCTAEGSLYAADWRGGVCRIDPNGRQALFGPGAAVDGTPLRPNGIALTPDGSFLIAHLGAEAGGVYRLARDGTVTPVLLDVDGAPLPPTNYVMRDRQGRMWVTVSTRHQPRDRAYRNDVADGFIVLADDRGARIVADGLGYTNEVQIDPTGDWLYVNETMARRLSRFRLAASGDLGDKQVVTQFGAGSFPDGLAFDVDGGVWVTAVLSNRIIHVAPDGRGTVVVEDHDPAVLAVAETAYREGNLGRPHLDRVPEGPLKNISSLAFGGPDLRTAYVGCLLGDRIACFRSPVAGLEPVHWRYG